MPKYKSLIEKIINLNPKDFDETALEVFYYQYRYNTVYRQYIDLVGAKKTAIKAIEDIPFMPIAFFKQHQIKTAQWEIEKVFSSSGTTGMLSSKHYVRDVSVYERVSRQIFEQQYGSISDYHILALLPAYLEREGSSLVYMVNDFIQQTNSPHSGFYLHNKQELATKLDALKKDTSRKIILWGVSFALWELAEQFPVDLQGHIVIETGGMKGRREEILRTELHRILTDAFRVDTIHSEYGMTELMSQAYSKGLGMFDLPPQMRVIIRDINDPFEFYKECNKTGGINVVDLTNLHSCAFIETQDLGLKHANGMLEILGRFDNSDIRGCNLLI